MTAGEATMGRVTVVQAKAGPSRRQVAALLLAAPLCAAATRVPPPVDDEALRQAYAFTLGLG